MSTPTNALLWFIITTTIYSILQYIVGESNILYIIYLSFIIIGQFIININLTKNLCGSIQWLTTLSATIIPWTLIFGAVNILLSIFPGWLSPFSNTFGYGFAKIMGVDKVFDEIFLQETSNSSVRKYLDLIYSNKGLLINEITPQNFENFWTKSSSLFKSGVANNQQLKNKLLSLVNLKNIVSYYVWFMIVGSIVTTVSYNYIVNSKCSLSVDEISKKHRDYERKLDEEMKQEINKQKRVYHLYD